MLDRGLRRLFEAGAHRVVIRPAAVRMEGEMGVELGRIAEVVLT